MTNEERFLEIYKNVKRDGCDELLDFLQNKSDFFTAPASSRFHSCYEGGLLEHSIKVYERLRNLVIQEFGNNWQEKISEESIAIIGLFHDLCKVNFYQVEYRNVKENGAWIQKPYYAVNDKLPYGHGEKSVYMLSGFMKLTREEALAINWHMGGMDDRARAGSNTYSVAFYACPVVFLTHMADMFATYMDETIPQ